MLSFFASEFQQNMLLKNDRVCVKMEGENGRGRFPFIAGRKAPKVVRGDKKNTPVTGGEKDPIPTGGFMLKGIPKIVSPELIRILCEMGHGDEIVIADGNFPSENFGQRVIRADGIKGTEMLDAVLSLIPLDTYSDPNMILMQLMQCDEGKIDPSIWKEYAAIAEKHDKNVRIGNIDRFAFYERAKTAYAVIATGEEAVYANIILKKGVIA